MHFAPRAAQHTVAAAGQQFVERSVGGDPAVPDDHQAVNGGLHLAQQMAGKQQSGGVNQLLRRPADEVPLLLQPGSGPVVKRSRREAVPS
jgi:hypothetical protein